MKKKEPSKVGKKQIFLINLEPYSQDLLVVANGAFDDAYKWFLNKQKNGTGSKNCDELIKHIDANKDEYFEKNNPTTNQGMLYHALPSGFVMTFNHQKSWVETVGVVVHESVHLAHHLAQRVGLKLSNDSEEAYTYLVEKTVERILAKIF